MHKFNKTHSVLPLITVKRTNGYTILRTSIGINGYVRDVCSVERTMAVWGTDCITFWPWLKFYREDMAEQEEVRAGGETGST